MGGKVEAARERFCPFSPPKAEPELRTILRKGNYVGSRFNSFLSRARENAKRLLRMNVLACRFVGEKVFNFLLSCKFQIYRFFTTLKALALYDLKTLSRVVPSAELLRTEDEEEKSQKETFP